MKNKSTSSPDQVVLSSTDQNKLEERLAENTLTESDREILSKLLSFNQWLQDQLYRSKLTINRLKKLFGFTSESFKKKKDVIDENNNSPDNDGGKPKDDDKPKNKKRTPNWDHDKNHGRYSVDDYTGCPIVNVSVNNHILKNGNCPDCSSDNSIVKMYPMPPSVIVLLDSTPLISGTRYSLEKLRCSLCQKYFTATLPSSVNQDTKYSYQCSTSIAINHYYAGMPFKRIEMLQESQGVPVSDSTQYELMKKLYKAVISPIADALRSCAANGETLFFDDTPGKIVEQMLHNKNAQNKSDKSGVHGTALLSDYQGNKIYLFDTNKLTAGKQLKKLLSQRSVGKTLITMSDASASNFPELDESLMAKWIICLCLSHGRRKFVELLDSNNNKKNNEMQFILELITQVYINDKYCKVNRLTPADRLLYHQQHSGPAMAAMLTWFNNLILYKEVEPNSAFGEAIFYMIKRWRWITQFLHEPGAPIDNNICEQAIKVMIRYRNNSLFYRTFYGANIGDAMMSVIHTAARAGVNIFDYLNVLQENQKSVQQAPDKWLPWNFHLTMQEAHLLSEG